MTGEDWTRPTALPGWTVRDVIAHVAGIEHLLAGEPVPDVELPPASRAHVRNRIGELNEKYVQRARALTIEDAFADFREVVARRSDQLARMTDADLDARMDSPVGRVPYRHFLGVRVFDCWVHEDDIRHALGMPHDLGGGSGRFAVGEIVRALPRIVGKQAGAPDGARVRFRVTGADDSDLPMTTDVVVVDGRASLAHTSLGGASAVPADPTARPAPDTGVEPADRTAETAPEPTAELVFETPTFVRAATGRTTAEPGRGVELHGDRDLARAVLGSMAFTV